MTASPETSFKISDYHYVASGATWPHTYLLPVFLAALARHVPKGAKTFEIGAGNGHIAGELTKLGYQVFGIEPSHEGVRIARQAAPRATIVEGSVYDDLGRFHGQFDFVYTLEVIEHLYAPRELIAQARRLLRNGGKLCVSTPFHGYWKNLSLAVTGKLDDHFTALWDHGHVKFWSRKTLGKLFAEGGFEICEILFAGRFYPLSKSMLIIGRKI
jgi:2-polyprenyl-6-hydroxyphenyl methylase/3-demethylubiquinone-9 3-methyltransferase